MVSGIYRPNAGIESAGRGIYHQTIGTFGGFADFWKRGAGLKGFEFGFRAAMSGMRFVLVGIFTKKLKKEV